MTHAVPSECWDKISQIKLALKDILPPGKLDAVFVVSRHLLYFLLTLVSQIISSLSADITNTTTAPLKEKTRRLSGNYINPTGCECCGAFVILIAFCCLIYLFFIYIFVEELLNYLTTMYFNLMRF